jgi:hypothetical protein
VCRGDFRPAITLLGLFIVMQEMKEGGYFPQF